MMNHWLKSLRCTCWPVGQGLFTTADILVDDAMFRLVYDCGRGKALKTEPTWVRAMEGTPLDLLVISHFDADHINGISALLRRTNGAKRAWIPHVAPEMRPLVALGAGVGASASGAPPGSVGDMIRFAGDPDPWLRERGVEEVEVIGGDDMPGDAGPPLPREPVPPDRERLSDQDSERHGRPPKALRLGPLQAWGHAFHSESGFRAGWAPINPAPATGVAASEVIAWLLTWVRPLDPGLDLSEVHRQIAVVVGIDPTAWAQMDELSADEAGKLADRLSKPSRRELNELYKKIDHTVNAGSLFLMVYPGDAEAIPWTGDAGFAPGAGWWPWLGDPYNEWSYRLRRLGIGPGFPGLRMPRLRGMPEWRFLVEELRDAMRHLPDSLRWAPAALWCGDADTTVLERLLAEANAPLRELLEHTAFWGVPHHGSRHSLCSDFYREVSGAEGYVSCGQANGYGHPNAEVVTRTGAQVVTENSPPATWRTSWV